MNIELARKVLTHITEYPEKHDQALFMDHCGTVGCIAGWAVKLSGEDANDLIITGHLVARAEELLGIEHDQATRLFFDAYKEEDARELLASYIAEAEAAL